MMRNVALGAAIAFVLTLVALKLLGPAAPPDEPLAPAAPDASIIRVIPPLARPRGFANTPLRWVLDAGQ